jgi:hypothetical protein
MVEVAVVGSAINASWEDHDKFRALYADLDPVHLADPWFAAFTFSAKSLGGKIVHLTVPKDSILAIVGTEGSADTAALGFRIEETGT